MFNLIGKAHALAAGDFSPINPIPGNRSLVAMIVIGVNTLLWFTGVIAVIYLIYGGILYITAGGDAEKATKGRTAIINAVIGVVIILLALVILTYVKNTIK